ncbi:MAG: hypothetical protein R3E89_10180 [Thiolinea sp.]
MKQSLPPLSVLLGWGTLAGLALAGGGYLYMQQGGQTATQASTRTASVQDSPAPPVSKSGAQAPVAEAPTARVADNERSAVPPAPPVVAEAAALAVTRLDQPEPEHDDVPDEAAGSVDEDAAPVLDVSGVEPEDIPQAGTAATVTATTDEQELPASPAPEVTAETTAHLAPESIASSVQSASMNVTPTASPPASAVSPVSPNIARTESGIITPDPQPIRHPLVRHSAAVAVPPYVVNPPPLMVPGQNSVGARLDADAEKTKTGALQADGKTEARQPVIDRARLTANGQTRDELISSAYAAIEAGKLGEEANLGAVYYIRLLKRIDRGNPQIRRLAREVATAYHVKAREAIHNKHQRAAEQLLWMAARIIKEFNLVTMNEPQQILEHRLAE